MIYRFIVISEEVEDFVREIKIDPDATFLDFHKQILASCGYSNDQMTSFYICNDEWEPTQQVLMEDTGCSNPDEDVYLMRSTRLSELIEDEKQKLAFEFDPVNERVFLIELMDIMSGNQESPTCSRSKGDAPQQVLYEEELPGEKGHMKGDDTIHDEPNEDFYGSEDFEDEEFDTEGFEISDGNPYK